MIFVIAKTLDNIHVNATTHCENNHREIQLRFPFAAGGCNIAQLIPRHFVLGHVETVSGTGQLVDHDCSIHLAFHVAPRWSSPCRTLTFQG